MNQLCRLVGGVRGDPVQRGRRVRRIERGVGFGQSPMWFEFPGHGDPWVGK